MSRGWRNVEWPRHAGFPIVILYDFLILMACSGPFPRYGGSRNEEDAR